MLLQQESLHAIHNSWTIEVTVLGFRITNLLVMAYSPVAQMCNASPPSPCQGFHVSPFAPPTTDTLHGDIWFFTMPFDAFFHPVNLSDSFVFEHWPGFDYLRPIPSYEIVFDVPMLVCEAPVHVAAINKPLLSYLVSMIQPCW